MTQPKAFLQPLAILIALAVGACQAGTTEQPVATAGSAETEATEQDTSDTKGTTDMTALDSLLNKYASLATPSWEGFDAVKGVSWSDAGKLPNPDGQPNNAFYRSGRLLLAGFGETDLPNGKTGPEADYVRGNEGDAGITLNGTENEVTSIAVNKFYPDEDYAKVLRSQIGTGEVRVIASRCQFAEGTTTGEENYARNEFFQVSLTNGAVIFAEGATDEEGGKYTPGSTNYFFYKEEPTGRIDSMKCKRS